MVTDTPDMLRVFEGLELKGQMNTPDVDVIAHVRSAIRRGHPQIRLTGLQFDRIVLVGSGPSLNDTQDELLATLRAPDAPKLVTMNAAYHWCLEHNLTPGAQVVVDARASSARFVDPPLPNCRYYIASQCHPAVWDAVAGRPHVGIFHAVSDEGDGAIKTMLDAYYLKQWHGVPGGTTVFTRALGVLRSIGYLRFEVFGVDSCWMGGRHHAVDQPENAHDHRFTVTVTPPDRPDLARTFHCAPWHLKQLEDVLLMIRMMGEHFLLSMHGDGLIAYAIATEGQIAIDEEQT